MEWKIVRPLRSGGGRRSSHDYAIRLSMVGKGTKQSPTRLAITISKQYLRFLKWKIGDKINYMEAEKDGVIGLERTPDGERVISYSSKTISKSQQNGRIQIAVAKHVLDKICGETTRELASDEIIIDGDIIAIPFLN